nr:hypothetical protein [uncultured Agathobaculum sp.]
MKLISQGPSPCTFRLSLAPNEFTIDLLPDMVGYLLPHIGAGCVTLGVLFSEKWQRK